MTTILIYDKPMGISFFKKNWPKPHHIFSRKVKISIFRPLVLACKKPSFFFFFFFGGVNFMT